MIDFPELEEMSTQLQSFQSSQSPRNRNRRRHSLPHGYRHRFQQHQQQLQQQQQQPLHQEFQMAPSLRRNASFGYQENLLNGNPKRRRHSSYGYVNTQSTLALDSFGNATWEEQLSMLQQRPQTPNPISLFSDSSNSSLDDLHNASNSSIVFHSGGMVPIPIAINGTGTGTGTTTIPTTPVFATNPVTITPRFSDLQRELFAQLQQQQQQKQQQQQQLQQQLLNIGLYQGNLLGTNAITPSTSIMMSRKRTLQECTSLPQLQLQNYFSKTKRNTLTNDAWGVPSLQQQQQQPHQQEHQRQQQYSSRTGTETGTGTRANPAPILLSGLSPSALAKNRANALWKKVKHAPGTKNSSTHTVASIPRAIRRRLHSMIRGTSLVEKTPPPIVIESGNETHDNITDEVVLPQQELPQQKQATKITPVIGITLSPEIPIVWKSKNKAKENKKHQQEQQVYLRYHTILGQGAFATVASVTIEDSLTSASSSSKKTTTTTTLTNGKNGDRCYYACKFVREEIFVKAVKSQDMILAGEGGNENGNDTKTNRKNFRAYVQAESQLAYEAHLLGSLLHPNIIRLIGFFPTKTVHPTTAVTAKNTIPTESSPPERSVLLTELLDETLAQKLSRWKSTPNPEEHQSVIRKLEKVAICQQLANALEHVHSHKVAYRDLKPENVGFSGSTLKLFDFGLSREIIALPNRNNRNENTTNSGSNHKIDSQVLPTAVVSQSLSSCSSVSQSSASSCSCSAPSSSTSPPSHQMLRGMIGTMRYMAPEVCLEEDYDCDCDLYSYSVLCWEIWTHKTPYSILTPASYREMVCLKNFRPPQVENEIDKLRKQQQRGQGGESGSGNVDRIASLASICRKSSASTCPLPKAIEDLLEKGWVRDPKSRIQWPEIRQELDRVRELFAEAS